MIPRVMTFVCGIVLLAVLLWLPRGGGFQQGTPITPKRSCGSEGRVPSPTACIIDDSPRPNIDVPAADCRSQKSQQEETKPPSGNILESKKPEYPFLARTFGIEGQVVVHGYIGKDGRLEDLTVVSGPRLLRSSTMDTLAEWRYKPYTLNGEPVDVETTIVISYCLPHKS